jgi:hypothetical protein
LYLGKETADKLEALRQPAAAPAADTSEVETLRSRVTELEANQAPDPKTREAQMAQEAKLTQDRDKAWGSVVSTVENFINNYADDTKAGLGLKVSAEEQQHAPQVALLKALKRDLLLNGNDGDLPYFEKGLGEWGKEDKEFGQILAQALHYSEKLEQPNVDAAAQKLLPYADRYLQERLKHPVFATLDAIIQLVSAQTNPKVTNDAIIPGAPVNSQPQASDAHSRISDLLMQDAMSVR